MKQRVLFWTGCSKRPWRWPHSTQGQLELRHSKCMQLCCMPGRTELTYVDFKFAATSGTGAQPGRTWELAPR